MLLWWMFLASDLVCLFTSKSSRIMLYLCIGLYLTMCNGEWRTGITSLFPTYIMFIVICIIQRCWCCYPCDQSRIPVDIGNWNWNMLWCHSTKLDEWSWVVKYCCWVSKSGARTRILRDAPFDIRRGARELGLWQFFLFISPPATMFFFFTTLVRQNYYLLTTLIKGVRHAQG